MFAPPPWGAASWRRIPHSHFVVSGSGFVDEVGTEALSMSLCFVMFHLPVTDNVPQRRCPTNLGSGVKKTWYRAEANPHGLTMNEK